MAINMKAKQDKTLCGGTINSLIDHVSQTTKLTFKDIKEVAMCPECPFRNMCPADRDITYIEVLAFTGMQIGVFPIIRETKTLIEVETKQKQIIRFDRRTGVQTNCVNSRYANRVNPDDIPAFGGNKEVR